MTNSLFRDDSISNHLSKHGYVIIKNFFNDEDLGKLQNESFNYISKLDESFKNGFRTLTKGKEKEASKKIIDKYFVPVIRLLLNEHAEIIPGVHLIKNRGLKGRLGLHQDSAIIDEKKYRSFAVWMPLADTHYMGGALTIVPGSHLFGNFHRSPVLENPLNRFIKKLEPFSISIPLKPGSLIIFDNALFHGSKINLRHSLRVAVNGVIKPKNAPLTYYYPSKKEEIIEVYEVDSNFYESENIYDRPLKYPLINEVKNEYTSINFDILKEYKKIIKE